MPSTKSFARLAATLAALLVVAGAAGAQTLTGAGATFPYPLYSKWFDAYHEKKGVEINYQAIGSGAGIQQVKAGTVDFGASDAALSDAQLKDMPRRVLHIPTVAGAVVLAYDLPGFNGTLHLTPELVAGIYLGKITSWNDRRIVAANPGVSLPAAPILAVHRSDGSGTTNIFTSYLAAVSTAWKELVGAGTSVSWPSGVGGKGNDGVSGVVKQTPGAIGYVELAYARQNQLPIALVRNRAGQYVEPSLASTVAAVNGAAAQLAKDVRAPIVNSASPDAWPIAGLTFLLVYQDTKDATRARQLADFLDWAIHDGQEYAEALEYARLPDAVVRVNEATLKLLSSGGRRLVAVKG
ncbi:MAG TPA: phosphate ABC transporter substrate-binding protein PstS [Candidatus Acidoferrales bacterium]|nr:phosphate ABC transporter substrate-binding protein PstS [Candidatus Acidoferrales bacterium]